MSASDGYNGIKVQISKWVHAHYWEHDDNCATTMISCLSKLFNIEINEQVWAAALGMHGAGGYRGQCGLVEGGLLFIGIYGIGKKMTREKIVYLCRTYAKAFEANYSSISCYDLRPEGFKADDPPHPCEGMTTDSVWFSYQWILNL